MVSVIKIVMKIVTAIVNIIILNIIYIVNIIIANIIIVILRLGPFCKHSSHMCWVLRLQEQVSIIISSSLLFC